MMPKFLHKIYPYLFIYLFIYSFCIIFFWQYSSINLHNKLVYQMVLFGFCPNITLIKKTETSIHGILISN